MKGYIIPIAIALGLLRPGFIFWEMNRHVSMSYQAVCHLLVGGLFAAYYGRQDVWARFPQRTLFPPSWRDDWMFNTAFGLSVAEIVCAAFTIGLKVIR